MARGSSATGGPTAWLKAWYLVTALLCAGLLLDAATSPARTQPGQVAFSAEPAGDLIHFTYTLSTEDGNRQVLRFQLPRKAIERARQRFRAYDPRELERLARAEFRGRVDEAVASLSRTYPEAHLERGKDDAIAWRIAPGGDFADRQRALYDRVMAEELRAIRSAFPRAKITTDGDGYRIEAPGRDVLAAIQQRLGAAQERGNAAVERLADEERSRMERSSADIEARLQQEIRQVEADLGRLEAAYYHERLYKVLDDRRLRPDYARIAQESLEDLRPVADAVSALTRGRPPREGLNRLLLFLQTIPYDRLDDRATDAGFLLPLVLLAENRGDCDSKAVAFAALARLLYPDVPSALVLVPQHAFVALGLPPARGDRTLRHGGREWVLAEPVGPHVLPVGRLGEESERKLGQIEDVIPLFR
jgi:transglutaminase-like putative cysteine protease